MNSLHSIITRAESPMSAALVFVLAWVATCDGEVSSEELDGLVTIATTGKTESDLGEVLALARAARVPDIQLACEILREVPPTQRRLLLQLTVGMALEDEYLTTGEGHIVRFVADVLSMSPHDLDSLFREMTGESFPSAADPSSSEWWESREGNARGQSGPKAEERAETPSGSPRQSAAIDVQRLRDLAVLGLDDLASMQEIKEA